jgi:pyruvate/2-oxoglutarate dehydrogenase complex dihydrolipoamide acyltransferase (E2) component
MAVTRVVMPKLSEAMKSGKLSRWLKQEGERVAGGDIIAEIETDKADIELEAFGSGVLRKVLVAPGATVPVGNLIAVIAEPGEDIAGVLGVAGAAAPAAPAAPTEAPRDAGSRGSAQCSCGQPLRPHWVKCPRCKKRLGRACACGEPLEAGWDECPACGRPVE